jgi:methionyl-tRNA formyltransferase
MKIACVSYRKWALDIYDSISSKTDHEFLIVRSKEEYDEDKIINFKPDYVLFYGWSWIIDSKLINDYTCIMLHPSPLPKYRGGSPIQNQIVQGENSSMVSIFKMTDKLDDGDIIRQKELSLEGNLHDIFTAITQIGTELTLDFLENGLSLKPQDHSRSTYFKRRKPADGNISSLTDIEKVYDFIRMMDGDGYPAAFAETETLKMEFANATKQDGYVNATVKIHLK